MAKENKAKVEVEVEVELKRGISPTTGEVSSYVHVKTGSGTGSGVEVYLRYESIKEQAENFSRNEWNKIIAECERIIDSLSGGNCPSAYRKLLNQIRCTVA